MRQFIFFLRVLFEIIVRLSLMKASVCALFCPLQRKASIVEPFVYALIANEKHFDTYKTKKGIHFLSNVEKANRHALTSNMK